MNTLFMASSVLPDIDMPMGANPPDIDVIQILMEQVLRATPSTGLVVLVLGIYYYFFKKRPTGRQK